MNLTQEYSELARQILSEALSNRSSPDDAVLMVSNGNLPDSPFVFAVPDKVDSVAVKYPVIFMNMLKG